jgi:lambda family phage tail tape measure protein
MTMADEKRVIEIVVKAVGDADLKRIASEMQGMRKETQSARKEMEQSNKTLASMRKEAAATRREIAQTNQTLGGFGSTFSKLGKAFGAGFALTKLVQSSDIIKEMSQNVQDLTGEFLDATLQASGFTDELDEEFWMTAKQGARDLGTAIGDIFSKMKTAGEDSSIAKAWGYMQPGVWIAKGVKKAWGSYAESATFDAPTLDTQSLLGDLSRDTAKLMQEQAKEAFEQAQTIQRNRREFAEQQRKYRESITPSALRIAGADSNKHPVNGPGPDAQAFARELDEAASTVSDMSEELGAMGEGLSTMTLETFGWTDALDEAVGYMKLLNALQGDLTNQAIMWGDSLTFAFKGVLTGELHNTRDLLRQVTTEMRDFYAELAARAAAEEVLGWIRRAVGLIGGAASAGSTSGSWTQEAVLAGVSAKGNAFDRGRVVAMANGGIVTGPTLFPMARGMGLMGEAGPEGVLPLKRGRDGRLGVISSGRGNVVIENHGAPVPATVEDSDRDMRIVLRAASLGANMALSEMNSSIRTGYGATAQSLSRSYGLRRR